MLSWADDNDMKYQADHMDAEGLHYPPVCPMVRAIAESLIASGAGNKQPKLNGLDRAVLNAQGGGQ